MPETAGARLRVVASRQRDKLSAARFEATSQPQLFSYRWTVLFLRLPSVEESDFVNILRTAQPDCVYDLRLTPSFNIGSLRRQKVFELFASYSIKYFDAAAALTRGTTREEAVAELVNSIMPRSASSTPIIFLLSGNEEACLLSSAEVERILRQSNEDLDVISIPVG